MKTTISASSRISLSFAVLLCFIAALAAPPAAADTTITVAPSQDTYVTQHGNLGGPNSTHGSDASLHAIRGGWGNYTYPLIQFDLSSYAGQNVTGPAKLELYVKPDFPQTPVRPVSVHEVLIPWDGNATFVNPFSFNASPPNFGFDTDVAAVALATRGVLYNAPSDSVWVDWTIPQAVVQSWIDDPASNHGLLVANEMLVNRYDLTFASMEDGVHAPRLTLSLNRPPDCSAAAAGLSTLWPLNHKLVAIDVAGVTDPDGDPVTITIEGISQDEPVDSVGDGDMSPDGFGVGSSTAQVRAERSGTGDGRVYRISFTATDGVGGSCPGVVTVGVPHNRGDTAVAGDTWADSTLP